MHHNNPPQKRPLHLQWLLLNKPETDIPDNMQTHLFPFSENDSRMLQPQHFPSHIRNSVYFLEAKLTRKCTAPPPPTDAWH